MNFSRTKQLGMSLIEVLASILIFSIGILGMVALQARATQVSLDAEDRSRAAVLANEAVALLWTGKTSNLTGAALTSWQTSVSDNSKTGHGLPSGSGTVTLDTTVVPNVTTVQITWKEPSHPAISRYTTSVVID